MPSAAPLAGGSVRLGTITPTPFVHGKQLVSPDRDRPFDGVGFRGVLHAFAVTGGRGRGGRVCTSRTLA